jgi:hypothetical protein
MGNFDPSWYCTIKYVLNISKRVIKNEIGRTAEQLLYNFPQIACCLFFNPQMRTKMNKKTLKQESWNFTIDLNVMPYSHRAQFHIVQLEVKCQIASVLQENCLDVWFCRGKRKRCLLRHGQPEIGCGKDTKSDL